MAKAMILTPELYRAEIDEVTKADWNKLVLQFDDVSIYQTWSYGQVRWGEARLSHLVLKRDNEAVGLAQVTVTKIPGFRIGIAYVPWGPLWRRSGSGENIDDIRQMAKALREEYAVRRGLVLRIVPNITDFDSPVVRSVLEQEGFGWNTSGYRTLILDLSPSLEALRKGLDQKWRNQLNRAEKNNLKVVEGTDRDLYLRFSLIYKRMIDRKHFDTYVDVNEFKRIQEDLPSELKMRVMLCENDGKEISGMVISALGNTGIYLLGATNEDGLKAKGSYLLQWRTIQWLRTIGCKYYDLGGIDPEGNPGVYHFKAGLRGREAYHLGQFEACLNPISSFVVKTAERVRSHQRIKVGTRCLQALSKRILAQDGSVLL